MAHAQPEKKLGLCFKICPRPKLDPPLFGRGGRNASFAQLLEETDVEKWGVIGLATMWITNCTRKNIAKSSGNSTKARLAKDYIRAVVSHAGNMFRCKPVEQMEKVLYTIDQLTGLIVATALVRPSKSILDLKPRSVKRKWKEKSFAAGVDRELIEKGAEMLGWELDFVIAETIKGMQTVAEEIGLKGNV